MLEMENVRGAGCGEVWPLPIGWQLALFDISISNIDCRYIDTFENIDIDIDIDIDMVSFENIDIDKANLKNIDIDIDIDKEILVNIDIDIDKEVFENIDIDKEILENIDIGKISNRLEFGISNRAKLASQVFHYISIAFEVDMTLVALHHINI